MQVVGLLRVAAFLSVGCCLVTVTLCGRGWGMEPIDLDQTGNGSLPSANDWSQFRGSDGQGHSTAKGLPLTWSESKNVTWKVSIAGLGFSSPVIQGEKIWLTTALKSEKSLQAICLERVSGQLLHTVEVFTPETLGTLHSKNSYASPTPILEGDRVYVHFGPYGTGCLTTNGEIVWKIILSHKTLYGPSNSPVLLDDLLIVQCHGTNERFIVALDKETGEERWKTTHELRSPELQHHNSESTPLVIHTPVCAQLICNVSGWVLAYDPKTGKNLWSVRQEENFAQVPRPVYGHGLVFTAGGYFSPLVQAIRPDGRGDVTKSHVVWSERKAIPNNPSPLLVGNELYLVSDKGIASCLEARTGKLNWRERLGGNYSASPLFADGRIYFANESGVITVVAASAVFRKLGTNKLDGRLLDSPAVSGKAIYLRTDRHLYRIEKEPV